MPCGVKWNMNSWGFPGASVLLQGMLLRCYHQRCFVKSETIWSYLAKQRAPVSSIRENLSQLQLHNEQPLNKMMLLLYRRRNMTDRSVSLLNYTRRYLQQAGKSLFGDASVSYGRITLVRACCSCGCCWVWRSLVLEGSLSTALLPWCLCFFLLLSYLHSQVIFSLILGSPCRGKSQNIHRHTKKLFLCLAVHVHRRGSLLQQECTACRHYVLPGKPLHPWQVRGLLVENKLYATAAAHAPSAVASFPSLNLQWEQCKISVRPPKQWWDTWCPTGKQNIAVLLAKMSTIFAAGFLCCSFFILLNRFLWASHNQTQNEMQRMVRL